MEPIEQPIPTHGLFKNIKGELRGIYTILYYIGKIKGINSWYCLCNICGNKLALGSNRLSGERVNNCKCYKISLKGMRKCTKCKKELPENLEYFPKRKGHSKGLRRDCIECHKKSKKIDGKRDRYKLKVEVLTYYGKGKLECVCCGEKDLDILTINHINNDGAEHRKKVGVGQHVYLDIKKNNFPNKYQTLCFNCNIAFRYGFCPHKPEIIRPSIYKNNIFEEITNIYKKCSKCTKILPLTNKYFCKSTKYIDGYSYTCKICQKERKLKIKQIVFNYYGNKCIKCGVSNIEFLNIDHVNNDGAIDRKVNKSSTLYRRIIKENFPNTFQLLCSNCNWKKHILYKNAQEINS